jgi:hypothetical protein
MSSLRAAWLAIDLRPLVEIFRLGLAGNLGNAAYEPVFNKRATIGSSTAKSKSAFSL